MNPFKAIGNAIVHPKRTTEQVQEQAVDKLIGMVLTKMVRHGLAAAGAAELATSDNTVNQIVGAISLLGSVGWSLFEGYMKHQADQKAAAQ